MKLRKRYLPVAAVLVVAVLGAAVAIMPALAAASPTEVKQLEVNQNCVDPDWPCWATPGSSSPALVVKIADGGEIVFTDHDASRTATVVWTSSAPTMCSDIPASASTPWEGKCEFDQPGTYKFESATLFDDENTPYGNANYTKYEIVVAGTPTDETTSASGETQTEAMLNGSINPEGNTVDYHFEYEGPGVTGKQSTPTVTLSAADSASHTVSAPVSGLEPGMTYNFLLVATYGVGKTSVSGATQKMFTTHAVTAPTATTLAAEGFKETEATLKGTINPGGEATEYFFEYGTGTGYGLKTEKATLLASGGNQSVSATLKGLTPGTEYHFRLVAKNNQGPAEGLDHSFKTMSPPTKEPPAKEPSPTPTPTGGNPTGTTSSSPSSGQPKIEPASGPLFGSLKLASTQHGGVVHGSLVVSSAGSEGQLQIELLTKGAAAPVGKLVRSSLHAGKLTFSLPLSAKAKHTLKAHHRLTLTVKIVLTPKHGAAMTLTRSVVVR
ncbi:MAG TPA: fibronectin type III domain-containing protein [Solirubrobacteraceae bacterium]|nr:fibronectin type III domain-containing protein [Solirubrobacteraceae bacterium]